MQYNLYMKEFSLKDTTENYKKFLLDDLTFEIDKRKISISILCPKVLLQAKLLWTV